MTTEYKGTFAGKNIQVFNSNKSCSLKNLKSRLSKYRLCDALKLIGTLSQDLFKDKSPFYILNDIPITEGILAYLAMELIQNTDDSKERIPNYNDIAIASKMYLSIDEAIDKNRTDGTIEMVVRYGTSQFEYNRPVNHIISRTLIIYDHLWQQHSSRININDTIFKICGLTIKEILIMTLYIIGITKNNGYFRIDKINFEGNASNNIISLLSDFEKKEAYTKWLSTTYSDFKKYYMVNFGQCEKIKKYPKNKFNYLVSRPIIIPDINPNPTFSKPFIIPLIRLLLEKVTLGLYHEFNNFFKNSSTSNEFRQEYGKVFEKYVILLIENFNKNIQFNIIQEFDYDHNKKTSDIIMIYDDKAVFIEIKQSCFYLNSKLFGEIEEIEKDARQTIAYAVKQLWKFETNLLSKKFEKLHELYKINYVERLIITNDSCYFTNSLLKECINNTVKKEIPNFDENYYIHTMSIEDFETLLGIENINVYEFLKIKRENKEYSKYDFNDYLAEKFGDKSNNEFLDRIYKEFFENIKESLK